MKTKKTYEVEMKNSGGYMVSRPTRYYYNSGTLEELIKYHSYTLEKGASWAHEKGNKKVNQAPKTIKSLITALNIATNNSAANGYSGCYYQEVPLGTEKEYKEEQKKERAEAAEARKLEAKSDLKNQLDKELELVNNQNSNINLKIEKMKISEIKKAAKELNELLGIEPPIDVKLKREVLLEKIKEAAELLEDGEAEDLSKSTQSILKQLSAPDEEENDEDKEDNVPTFDDLSVGEQIEEGGLDQLKILVKAEDTFKELRRGIGIQKKADVLREKMRVVFKEEQNTPTDKKVEKKADKKEIKKAEKRATAKENKKPGVIATIVEAVEKAGKKGITREEIHAKLVKVFPERASSSLMNTIKVQVPSRINKEKFKVETLKDEKFAKA